MFRWDETKFDELRLNNIFGNGCLNDICPIQAINAIDTEHSFLLANSSMFIQPTILHTSDVVILIKIVQQDVNIFKLHS